MTESKHLSNENNSGTVHSEDTHTIAGTQRTNPAGPVVVLGGTGKTGRRIVARLAERSVPARPVSRSTVVRFDWTDRSTWEPALSGARAVYVAYQPDLAAPGSDEAIAALTTAARRAGISRLVLLSGRGEPEAQRCEEIALASGLETTVVRCSWFAQNFSEDFLTEEILAGRVTLPADTVTEPFVDADDIADVAVAALTEDGHAGRVYELTGPESLTFADAVATIAAAIGREIEYVPVSLTDYTAAMSEMGIPADVVGSLTYLFGTVLDGRNSATADGVAQALGRPAASFADYARRTAAAGDWFVPVGDAARG
ncbi:SDR family oxidoreductase [Nocardia spumae]|uniref:SDR family oxidoreductase n=1 Tax=Nocardia spumae TaxID=2887190 RepID=UPI001D141ACA|nr:NAD(P)H-binding protein [Nocardia spumae]